MNTVRTFRFRHSIQGATQMKTFDVQSIGIAKPAAAVFAFVAEPSNLPKWTHAFKSADAHSAELVAPNGAVPISLQRSEEHTSELQSLMRISYAVFCLTKKKITTYITSAVHT